MAAAAPPFVIRSKAAVLMSLVAKRRGADTWQVLLPELLKTAGSGPAATEMVGNLFCSGAGSLQLCSVQWQPIMGVTMQTSIKKFWVQLSSLAHYTAHIGVCPPYSASLPPAWRHDRGVPVPARHIGLFRLTAIALYFPVASLLSCWAFCCSLVTHSSCRSTAGVLGAEFCDRGHHLLCG